MASVCVIDPIVFRAYMNELHSFCRFFVSKQKVRRPKMHFNNKVKTNSIRIGYCDALHWFSNFVHFKRKWYFYLKNGKTISFYTTTNSDLFECLFACMFTTNSTMLFYCTCFTNKLRLKMYAVGFLALVVAFILFINIDILPLFSYATFQRIFNRKSSDFQ